MNVANCMPLNINVAILQFLNKKCDILIHVCARPTATYPKTILLIVDKKLADCIPYEKFSGIFLGLSNCENNDDNSRFSIILTKSCLLALNSYIS